MGRKKLCPNGGCNGKKTPKKPPKGSSDTPPSLGSSHKGTREQIRKFTAEQMQACLDEIHCYQERQKRLGLPKMEQSMNSITKKHGLSPATVNKRMTGKVTGLRSQLGGAQRGRVLAAGEFQAIWLLWNGLGVIFIIFACMHVGLIFFSADERLLADTIYRFQLSGFPLTINRVRELAYQYAQVNNLNGFSGETGRAGRKWLKGFLRRHPKIIIRKARNLSIARAMGANPRVIGDWFQLLKQIKEKCGIVSPSQIWSGDETGVQNVPKEVKVLGCKKVRTFQQVASEQGETTSILTFINGYGKVVPPMVIQKGAQVQDSWRIKQPGDMRLAATTKGYITKAKFHEYGLRFVKYLKQNGLVGTTNLLIVDGHKSHLYNLPFYECMQANNIEVLTIPPPIPHTSYNHWIQPLLHLSKLLGKAIWEDTTQNTMGDPSIRWISGMYLSQLGTLPWQQRT